MCVLVPYVRIAVFHGILAFPCWETFFYSSRRPWLACYKKAVTRNGTIFLLGSLHHNMIAQSNRFHWSLWGNWVYSNPSALPRGNCRLRCKEERMKASSAGAAQVDLGPQAGVWSRLTPNCHSLPWGPCLAWVPCTIAEKQKHQGHPGLALEKEPPETLPPTLGRLFHTGGTPGGHQNPVITQKVPPWL